MKHSFDKSNRMKYDSYCMSHNMDHHGSESPSNDTTHQSHGCIQTLSMYNDSMSYVTVIVNDVTLNYVTLQGVQSMDLKRLQVLSLVIGVY